MKSIISRYGEMKADPSKMVDSEGEEMSLNKVDKALQSVGISIHDVNGQFRDFDDVIMELAESWNTIDKNTQRYIATVMAGNRQQSRFLALVSSYDRLKELSAEAANSEDAAQLQFLKTLDSIAAKTQQLQTSLQNLYVDSGLERFYGFLIDAGKSIVDTFNNMPKFFDLPILAIGKFGVAFWGIARIVTAVAKSIKTKLLTEQKVIESNITLISLQEQNKRVQNEIDSCNRIIQAETSSVEEAQAAYIKQTEAFKEQAKIREDIAKEEAMIETGSKSAKPGLWASLKGSFTKEGHYMGQTTLGLGLSTVGSTIASNSKKGSVGAWAGSAITVLGSAFTGVAMLGFINPILGAIVGTVIGLIQILPNVIVSEEERIKQLQEEAEEAKNTYIQKKSDTQNLATQIEQLRKLEKTMYDSKEAQDEYYQAANQFSDTYPELIKSLDTAGNAVIDLDNAELKLIETRKEGIEAAREAANKEYKLQKEKENWAIKEVLSSVKFKSYEEITFSDLIPSDKTLYQQFMTDDEYNRLLDLDVDVDDFERRLQFLLSAELKPKVLEALLIFFEHDYGKFYGDEGQLSKKIMELRQPVENNFNKRQDYITKYNKKLESIFHNLDLSYEEIIAESNKILNEINTEAPYLYQFYIEQIAGFKESLQTYYQEKSLTGSTISSNIARQINSYLQGVQDNYLQEIPDIIGFMTSEAVSAFNEQDKDFSTFNSEILPGLITTYTNFWEEFWESFDTQDAENEFINLLKNNKKMSRSKMAEQLSSEEFSELTDDARNSILSYYYDDTYNFDKFKDRYDNTPVITTLNEEINKDNNNILQELGSNELQVINAFNDELISLIKSNNYAEDDADLAMQDYLNIIRELRDDEVAQAIFFGWDRTLNGLQDVKQQLEELGYTNLNFNNLMQLPININTELNSYIDSLVSQLKDFEKALSKVSKGMDIKDAMEIANKLNISIGEFNFKDGKFFFKDAEKIQDAYINYSEELFGRISKEANERIEKLENKKDRTDDENKELDNLKKQIADINVLKDSYVKYQTNALRIQNGQIIEVLAEIAGNDQANTLYTQALQGDFTGFTGDLAQYISIITDILKDATDIVINAAVSSIKTDKGVYIKASEINQNLIQSLSRAGLAEYNSELEQYLLTVTKNNIDIYVDAINNTKGLTDLQKADYIKQGWDAAYSDNLVNIFTSFTSSATVTRKSADKFVLALGHTIDETTKLMTQWDYELDENTGEFKATGKSIQELQKLLKQSLEENASIEQINKIKAQIDTLKSQQQLDLSSALKDIVSNYKSITITQRQALADALKADYDAVAQYLIDNEDGTYSLNIGELRKALKEGAIQVGSVTENSLNELINGIIDDYLDAISSGIGYTTSGLTKQADMRKFVNDFNNKLKTTYNISDLFSWDTILEAYTLKPEYLTQYINKQRELLSKEFDNNADVDKYIESQLKAITQAVDISNFLQSENKAGRSRKVLENQMRTALSIQEQYSIYPLKEIVKVSDFIAKGMAEEVTEYKASKINESILEYNQKIEQQNIERKAALEAELQADLKILDAGGQAAVEIMKKYAGDRELTAEEIEAAYRVRLNNLSQAFESIATLQRGNVIDQNTRAVLNKIAGFTVNADGVIISTGNMIDAYQAIYEEMKKTSVATTAELNSAYAKLLTAKEQNEINAIDTLGNAMGMAYDALGELLSQYNMSLEAVINNKDKFGIEQLGTGKIRINDFKKFAAQMGWNLNSEEYWSAFKTYNDSLIELNKNTKTAIEDEVKSLKDVKGGDQINLTSLWRGLSKVIQKELEEVANNFQLYGYEELATESLFTKLSEFGASFTNGILTLDTNANIIQVTKILIDYAEQAGIAITEEMQDTLQSIIKAYSDAIIKGIQGGMTNVEAADLQNKALSLGISKIDFITTAEGLKLSQQSAIELYYALSNVDSLQAQLVFKELNESLKESNEHYKTMSSLMTHIKELQDAINNADSQTNPARIQQYKQELELAKDIAKVRLTTEDSSFDFMSADLNGALNNAPKYYEAWAKATKSVTEAAENGYIGWEDYARMINEIQNLAVQTGHDMLFMGQTIKSDGTSAAKLIEDGYKALDIDVESGTAVLNLDTLLTTTGLDFKQGAEGFSTTIDDGIKEFAQGQVKMLDGMIQLLETIVAMEQLGDIDADTFSFFDGEDFSKNYQNFINYATKSISDGNTDLEKAFNNTKINGKTLTELIGMSPDELKKYDNDFQKAYANVLIALNKAAQSGDWDTAWDVIKEQLAASGVDGLEIDLDDVHYVFKNGIMLEANEKGFIYNGKTYDTSDQAWLAIVTGNISALQDFEIEANDGTTIKYKGNYNVEITYDGATYTATMEDGAKLASNSPEGINQAILAWAKANNKESQENSELISDPITFIIEKEGQIIVNVSMDKEGNLVGNENQIDKAYETAVAELQKEMQQKAANTIVPLETTTDSQVSNTIYINVNQLKLKGKDADIEFVEGEEPTKPASLENADAKPKKVSLLESGSLALSDAFKQQVANKDFDFEEGKGHFSSAKVGFFQNGGTLNHAPNGSINTSDALSTMKALADAKLAASTLGTAESQYSDGHATLPEDANVTNDTPGIIESKVPKNYSLGQALATFAQLMVGLPNNKFYGSGDPQSGGGKVFDTHKITEALDTYKASLDTPSENGALQALFSTLGINMSAKEGTPEGNLAAFLTSRKITPEHQQLFCNFASLMIGLLKDSQGQPTVEGVKDIETFIQTYLATELSGEEIDVLIGIIHAALEPGVPLDGSNAIISGVRNRLANLGLKEEVINAIIKYIQANTNKDTSLSGNITDINSLREQIITLLGGENESITIGTIDAIIAGYNLILQTGLEEPNPEDFNSRKEYKLAFQEYTENQAEQEKNKQIWNDYLNEVFSTGNIDSLALVIQAISLLSGGAIIEEDGVFTLDFGNQQAYTALTKLIFVPASTYAASLSEQDRQVFINSLATELNRAGWHITPDAVWANIKATQIKTVIEGADEEGNIIIDGEKTSLANYLSRELTNLLQDETISPSAKIEALNLLINSLTSDPNSKIKINNDGSWSVDGQTVTLGVTNFIINAVTQSALNTELPLNIKFDPSVHNLFIDEDELANFIKAEDEGNLKTALELLLSKQFNGLGLEAQIELANAYIAAFGSLQYNGTPNATYIVTFDENGMPQFKLSSSIQPEGEIGSVEGKATSSDKKITVNPEDGITFDIGKISVTATIEKVSGALANGQTGDAADLVADGLEKYGIKELDEQVFSIGGNLVLDFSDINMNDSNVDESLKNAFYKEGVTAKEKLQAILSQQFSSMLKDDAITLAGLTFSLAENKIYIKAASDGTYKVYDKEGAELKPIVDVDGNIVGFTQVNENTNTLEGFDLYAPITGLIDITQVQEAINQGKYSVNAEVNPNGGSKAGGDVETRDLGGGTKGWPFGGGGGGPWVHQMLDPVNDWGALVKPFSKGNIALASGTTTLMGELGPELVVSNGHYFVVGQNGAEFINLPKDAIVFNHLQTQHLMSNGTSGRGKPVTNEKNAVSYAKGTGLAMASASSVLATLKHLRSQWQSLLTLSVSDLAGKGGGDGGDKEDIAGFIRDVERWYNWLQKIADLEKQINYEETLRSKIQSDMVSNGKAYYASQKRQLDQLRDSTITSSSLYLSQLDYFNQRREQLNNNSPLSELYTFDTTGQLHYQPGSYQWLAQLFKTNDYGQLELTPQQQYEMIMKRNPQFAQYMKYNSEGKEIKASDYEDQAQYYLDMVKAFSDRMDSEKEEMQSLFDSINEQGNAVNEKLKQQNELIQAMKDNQKEVEESVLNAIVEAREREIKEIQDTKDALQKSNEDFINGLSDQLEKERKLYDNNKNDEELNRNRRQLAILQRSGGSAAQIASLQKQIEEQSRDQYFDKQQEQIDAVKEASDLQIEKMDKQIELMNETLEYQKANGLLWGQVYEIMAGTPQQISDFIMQNSAAEWAKSPLSSTEAANDWIFKTEQWVSFRDDIEGIYDALTATWNLFDKEMEDMFGDIWADADQETIKKIFNAKYAETGDYNAATQAVMESDIYKNMKAKADALAAAGLSPQASGTNGKQNTTNRNTYYSVVGPNEELLAEDFTSWESADAKRTELLANQLAALEQSLQNSIQRAEEYANVKNIDSSFNPIYEKEKQQQTKIKSEIEKIKSQYKIYQYQYVNGGLIDFTGPAWVDGTKQRPESIWNAETTKLMKDNLLNSRNLNLLGTFWDTLQGYETAANHSYSNNSESLVIENAVVNMNVASIANDYDARRAGEQAMEEMLRIARKTRVSNF